MRKTILISQVFHPDEQATSQLLSDLLGSLVDRGHPFEVLAGFPAPGATEGKCPDGEVWRGIYVRRGGMRVDGKRNLLGRALAYGSYCLWLVWKLLFAIPGTARVWVVTNPPFAPVLVHWCSRFRGWSYDIILHDIYPDGLVEVGKLAKNSPIAYFWRVFNRRALAAADRVFVLGRDMADLLTASYLLPANQIIYLPNWSPIEPQTIQKPDATWLWSRQGFQDQFVVQYSGNMGLWHDMETIVRAAWLLRDDKDIFILLVGGGRRRPAAERMAMTLGLSNLCWLPFQRKEDLGDSLSCCHAALISQGAGLEGIAVPSKLYGILATGRAVLAQVPASSEVAQVVREEDCGLVIEPGDAQGLADAIKRLAQNRSEADAMGERAFAAYRSKSPLAAAVARFEQTLTSYRVS